MKYLRSNRERGEISTIIVFILIMIALWILWYNSGGPERAGMQGEKPFLNPSLSPESNGTGEPFGPGQN